MSYGSEMEVVIKRATTRKGQNQRRSHVKNAENAADAMMKRHPDLNREDIAAAFKR